jgi:23S rRNA pseudouridine1911/1915/1917 synthase
MLDRVFHFSVDEAEADERLDKFLALKLPHFSRSKIKAAIDDGAAMVNGVVVKPSTRLSPGESISLLWHPQETARDTEAENLPLEILFEDDALAVVVKPSGMVVHVGAGVSRGTLVNALRFHLKSLSESGDPLRAGIVHRLDKLTSGLMVVAKSDAAHAALSEQFRSRQVEKRYITLVHGRMRKSVGEIDLPVSRDRIHRTRMTTRRIAGREALTRYRVIREFERYSLLDVEIKTGRTHQIRVHLSALGHPVVGDHTYGAPQRIWLPGHPTTVPAPERHFLHAAHLSFHHPTDHRRMVFDSPLPQELADFLVACAGEAGAMARSVD